MRYAIVGLVLVLAGCAGAWAAESQAPAAAAVPTPAPTPAGRIVGWVFADANGNRLLDTGEVISVSMVTAQLGASVLTQATVAGWFGFGGMADGQWQVSATAAGYSCELCSAAVAGGKTTVNVPCHQSAQLGTATITPTTTMIPLPPTPTATSMATPASVDLAAQICPDATPLCVQVWLGTGTGAQWWPACPEGRSQVSRFCLSVVGQWVSLP